MKNQTDEPTRRYDHATFTKMRRFMANICFIETQLKHSKGDGRSWAVFFNKPWVWTTGSFVVKIVRSWGVFQNCTNLQRYYWDSIIKYLKRCLWRVLAYDQIFLELHHYELNSSLPKMLLWNFDPNFATNLSSLAISFALMQVVRMHEHGQYQFLCLHMVAHMSL